MKKIEFRKKSDQDKGIKTLAIGQKTEDKDCITFVNKSFRYKVSCMDEMKPKAVAPQIYIRKSFDTKTKVEKFSFHVKGRFYLSHKRMFLKVQFDHNLDIEIQWKKKDFSPKKSAVLTK